MLTKVEVRNTLGLLLTLELEDVSDGLVLEDIQGLDPVKATLVSSGFANLDGVQFQSSRREARNLVLILGLEPDYVTQTVYGLRRQLYSFFMPKSLVSLRLFDSEGLTVDIQAMVEDFNTSLFSKEPQVNIPMTCFDPDFVELTPIVVAGNTVSTSTEFNIPYDGTVETGIEFKLNLDRSLSAFTIYHRPADDQIRTLNFAASLISGDVLTINTVVGSKAVTLLRSSVISSLLYAQDPQSNWIELLKGDNHFRVYATGAAIPFTITYTPRHGGL